MQVTVEQLDPCKVQINIEVEAEKVAETIIEVYGEFAKVTNVPGFRKGKAPRNILEHYVSPESLRREAIDHLVAPSYLEALKEKDIHPYADPEVEIIEFETDKPFTFKAIVPLPPKIELGEYKGIEVKRPKVKITDKDVEAQMKYLQESRATSTKVDDRGVQEGDVLVSEMASALEGQDKGEPKRSLIQLGSNVPGFDEQIMGMKPGERRTFAIKYPNDFPDKDTAGKKVEFDVALESIRERHIPELNDEFAKTMGGFETLDAMREDVKTRLIASAEESADKEVELAIIKEIIARSKVDFPDILVEHEIGHDIEELQQRLSRQGMNIQQYLQQTGKTQEEFLSELREAAAKRIQAGLILAEVSDAEKIDITDEEVDAEIERMATESKATKESVEAYIEARGGKPSLKNLMLNKKILDLLKSVSTIK